ncbi:MAG: Polyketide cyclase/dehydrase [Marmoricola sp.]|nr:Polyketide cyclase/dehydrase [Marmoricola sp.]
MKLNVRRSFTTTAAPATAFAFLADFRNAEKWDPGTVRCSLLSDAVGTGATYRNVSEFLGREADLTYTTLVHDPYTRLHFQGHNDAFVGDDRMTLSPDGTGTRIDYHATFDLRGASALATPVVAVYLPSLAKKTINQLRATLDALPG